MLTGEERKEKKEVAITLASEGSLRRKSLGKKKSESESESKSKRLTLNVRQGPTTTK